MAQKEIIRRIERLEFEVEILQRKVKLAAMNSPRQENTYRDYIGMFRGDKHFLAAVEAGARYRFSFRPGAKNKRTMEKWIKSYMSMFKD